MDETTELTTAEAAALAGVAPRTVREWHSQGKVAGRKTAAGLVVERRSLEDRIRRRGGAGAEASAGVAEASADLAALVAALERAQAEALMLAGRVGWLEAQIQQRDATILRLTAGAADGAEPGVDGAADTPPGGGGAADGDPPWWARLRRWWARGGY